MRLVATVGDRKYAFEAALDGNAATVDGRRVEIAGGAAAIDGRRVDGSWERREEGWVIVLDGLPYRVEIRDELAERARELTRAQAAPSGEVAVCAPIPGLVRRVLVAEGQAVVRDQPVLTLDAMKLENELPSPRDGVVRSVRVRPGLAVEKGQVLLVIG